MPSEWIQQSDVICYKGRSNQFARFTITGNQYLYAIRLRHVSGGISCRTSEPKSKSRWGCSSHKKTNLLSLITNNANTVKFLDDYSSTGLYQLQGYEREDDVLVYKAKTTEYLSQNTNYKLWHGHDRFNFHEDNKRGEHCVIVDASFLINGRKYC